MVISDSDYNCETSDGDYDSTKETSEKEIDMNQSPRIDFDNDNENCAENAQREKELNTAKSKKGTRVKKQEEEMQGPESEAVRHLNWTQAQYEEFREWQRTKQRNGRRRKKKSTPILTWELWEYELDRWTDEHISADIDLDQHNEVIKETRETPAELTVPLLRYQKEWLAWSIKQEESDSRGGILADEMGMGKTLQAIALVLAKRKITRLITEAAGPSSSASSSTGLPEIKSTLVVCPVVAVSQWVNEILQFTSEGSTKVLVYHGPNRARGFEQFSNYDFVITTYSIVESDFRKYMMPPKDLCQWCGKQFYAKKMTVHLRYFCGPTAVRTSKQSKQNRKQKNPQILSKLKTKSGKNKFSEGESDEEKVASNKNTKKRKRTKNMGTTVTLENPVEPEIREGKSILHSIKWERIILDEAHYIKERRSNTARAVLSLESSYKWALSGTPLQNRVGELYSLIRFLQIVPYSFYWCKDCNCRMLDYSSTSECKNCPHKSVRHFCWWNKHVATPIQDSGNNGNGIRAMVLLKHKILKSILLRRTKKGRASDLALPPRIITLRRDNLDVKEMDYYTALYNDSQAEFNTYVSDGTLTSNYAHIFDLLTRLRQAVDHPYLVVYSKANSLKCESNADNDKSEQECGICHDPVEDSVTTACQHIFCKACLLDYSSSLGQAICPTCTTPLTADFTSSSDTGNRKVTTLKGFRASSILSRIRLDDFQTSTKVDALREEIRFMIERDGSAKAIVFSQFTSFLDLINYSLQKSGISCVQLVGSMTMAARDLAITKFNDDPDCRIFLMSLKAGGVALNLTVASHVFLMDPWWNPAVERQAMDRIHRIGQYKPIRIVRFVIENTVEERILKLQEKKELVFEGTVGGSEDALGKLTVEDLRFLFY